MSGLAMGNLSVFEKYSRFWCVIFLLETGIAEGVGGVPMGNGFIGEERRFMRLGVCAGYEKAGILKEAGFERVGLKTEPRPIERGK